MMLDVNADELRTLLEVACVTEDRAVDEQRAMLRLAYKLDMATMKQTTTNHACRESNMVGSVLHSLDPHCDGADVRLPGDWMVKHQRKLDELRSIETAIADGKLRPDEA